MRRGHCGSLWAALLAESGLRLDRLKREAGEQVAAEAAAAAADAAASAARKGQPKGRAAQGAAKRGKDAGKPSSSSSAMVVDGSGSGSGAAAGFEAQQGGTAGGPCSTELAAAQSSLARILALLGQAVHFFRCGSPFSPPSPLDLNPFPAALTDEHHHHPPPLIHTHLCPRTRSVLPAAPPARSPRASPLHMPIKTLLFQIRNVHSHRGSRVESYAPLQSLLGRLSQQFGVFEEEELPSASNSNSNSNLDEGDGAAQKDEAFLHISLTVQVCVCMCVYVCVCVCVCGEDSPHIHTVLPYSGLAASTPLDSRLPVSHQSNPLPLQPISPATLPLVPPP